MKTHGLLWSGAALALALGGALNAEQRGATPDVRLMTLDPGHFHAALIQKEMYPGVAARVDVYAPLGPDLFEHLNRVAGFNRRAERPTAWDLEVHTSPDYFERMLKERPGNVVVLSGRNGVKMDRILASVKGGLHVLADKPWILKSADLPKVDAALAEADARKLVAYDIMTERFEVTTMLQRALVNDRATFGEIVPGSETEPSVYMESVHHLMKVVAGAPNIRPPWFFDTNEQGEAASDIGTHLVDLVQWTLFPDRAIDYRADTKVLAAQRWPTWIPETDFRRVTNAPGFPKDLAPLVKDGRLEYYCNTLVSYTLKGIHTKLNIIWDWEAPAGSGDTHFAFYRGTRARIEIRQTKADRYLPGALYRSGQCRGEGRGARGGAGEDQGGAGRLPGCRRRGSRRRDQDHRPRRPARRPRGALRSGGVELPQVRSGPQRAARLGTSEHACEVLRHDDGCRVEPEERPAAGAADRSAVGVRLRLTRA